jgi:LPXTG-motif cell wall-anchored protein
VIQITVLADGTIRQDTKSLADKGLSYDASTFTMSVKDETVPYEITIIKKNEKGKLLSGAQFTLYEDAACTKELQTVTTDANGKATFTSLFAEKLYYVKETKAPEGYRIPQTDGEVRVYAIQARSVPVKNIFTVEVDQAAYSASASNALAEAYITGSAVKQTLNLNVVNYTTQKLPETGSNGSAVILLAGAALMLFGLKERKKHEKTNQQSKRSGGSV